MATQVLAPTAVNPVTAGVVTNVTSGLTVITGGNTVQFPNVTGLTSLLISVGTTGGTIQANIGTTIFGQSYAPFATINLTASTLYVMGFWHTALDAPGGNLVSLVTQAALVSSMIVLQYAGVY